MPRSFVVPSTPRNCTLMVYSPGTFMLKSDELFGWLMPPFVNVAAKGTCVVLALSICVAPVVKMEVEPVT